MQRLIEKANVLVEALPYLSRFRGRIIVIKYGGHAMDDPELRRRFVQDVVLLRYVGLRPVVVHGGGPQIGALLERLGIGARFENGLRVTDEQTMTVVEMVLSGQVNRELVGLIGEAGGRAVGLSGRDGRTAVARRMPGLGRVGEVTAVEPSLLQRLLDDPADIVPIVAPVCAEEGGGGALNVNADPFAAHVAASLGAEKLVLITDVAGVQDASGELLPSLGPKKARRMIEEGIIRGGMIPKVEFGLQAIAGGVRKVHIVDGRVEHALLLEIFTDRGVGTELVAHEGGAE